MSPGGNTHPARISRHGQSTSSEQNHASVRLQIHKDECLLSRNHTELFYGGRCGGGGERANK